MEKRMKKAENNKRSIRNYSGKNERLATLAKSYSELQSEWYSVQSGNHYGGPGSNFSVYDTEKIEKMMDEVSKEAEEIRDELGSNMTDEDKENFSAIL